MAVCWYILWAKSTNNLSKEFVSLVATKTIFITNTNIYDIQTYTLCLKKKFPPLNSLQLCQILTDFQNFCTAGKPMKFATKPDNIIRLTLGMLLHYLGTSKTQIVCKYSADMEKCNKLHFQCTDYNSCTRVTVYAECIYVFSSKSCPRR